MANEAYRAVFLRVHPTGKMVLSLTSESDGKDGQYAQLVADELGVPPLDVKVVALDTDRFGVGHGYNTTPSEGTAAAIVSASAKIRDKARLLAGMALEVAPERLTWINGAWVNGSDERPGAGQDDRGHRPLRPRHRRPAAGRRGRARRADRLPRLTARTLRQQSRPRHRGGAPAAPAATRGDQFYSGSASSATSTSSATLSAPNRVE